jgi:DNA-binding NarL/FixJ family response regulator
MAARRVRVSLWFAAENLDLECYRAKVGTGFIVFSIGNVTKLPFKHRNARQRQICRVVADNVRFFFLSRHSEQFICKAFDSCVGIEETKSLKWLGKMKGKPVYYSLRKMRRTFSPPAEIIFRQFESACLTQCKIPTAEYSVVPHLLAGLTNKEIAEKLGNSTVTVAQYVGRIRTLLGIKQPYGSSRKDRAGLVLALLGNLPPICGD